VPQGDGVYRLVERHSTGHAIAEYLHDAALERQTQIVGHEGGKVLLQRVGPAHREDERTDLLLGDARDGHGLDHQRRQNFVL
jgi:hypothetical protein